MKHVNYFLKQIHLFAGKTLYMNLIAMVFISLLEGIGILLLIPMINISGVVNIDTGKVFNVGAFNLLQTIPNNLVLPIILAIYVLIVIGQNVLQRQITIRNAMIQHGFFRYLRINTYSLILYSNWDFFIKKRKSDLINVLTTEITRASAGTHSFLQFITSLIFTFMQIALAFVLSPNITIFVLLSGLVLIFFNRKFLRRSLTLGNTNFELGKNYLAGITDQINGIKDIKSNTLEESRMEWYQNITQQMRDEQVAYTKLRTKSQFYYKASSALLIAVFILVAINLYQAQSGELMLIIIIFSRLWPRVSGIQSAMEQIAATLPSFKAVITLQKECQAAKELKCSDKTEPLQIREGIQCSNISFRYDKNKPHYALNNITVNIPVNQTTAVVGRSGAGKSTLIDLLMGLNSPESGDLLVDGTPLKGKTLLSLRRAVSYVPQDPFLFNTSIKDNLLLINETATEEQMWEALEFSSAGEFVRRLPQGLDTIIGDRGIKLSGGERQRIVLARAILRKPSILILDEATSALDSENELKIQEAIDRLKGKMTIIVIAHRLSTIRNADRVIVLDQGEVIQHGEYSLLAKEKRGELGKLLKKQKEALR
jgi:ABC-type multidrug transport system fused ATPase/permease subunit